MTPSLLTLILLLTAAVGGVALALDPSLATGFLLTQAGERVGEPRGGITDDALPSLAKGIPLGRLGEPFDVAAAVVFLASPAGSWITGQTLAVAGGRGGLVLLAGAVLVGKKLSLVPGRIEGHRDGHGFLVPDEAGEDQAVESATAMRLGQRAVRDQHQPAERA